MYIINRSSGIHQACVPSLLTTVRSEEPTPTPEAVSVLLSVCAVPRIDQSVEPGASRTRVRILRSGGKRRTKHNIKLVTMAPTSDGITVQLLRNVGA